MPTYAVIGGQFGDEAKGKVIDSISYRFPKVVGGARYAGGNNAGHTVVHNGNEYKMHITACTVFSGKPTFVSRGVVIDPDVLIEELTDLENGGIDTSVVRVSNDAHVIISYHILEDQLLEAKKGRGQVGTTGRGIGTCYADKSNRIGIKIRDLLDREELQRKLSFLIPYKQDLLQKVYGYEGTLDEAELLEKYASLGEKLRPYVTDDLLEILDLTNKGVFILEGAQGTALDIDLGNYPYVTSSNPTVGGSLAGTGLPRVDEVLLVFKAYITRVGGGPLPTEETGDVGNYIVEKGWEYGATTSRRRRPGWFDCPLARYSIAVNGADSLAVTKIDVLGDIPKIKVATGYKLNGKSLGMPSSLNDLDKYTPEYEEFDGWPDLSADEWRRIAQSGEDALPLETKSYIGALEDLLGKPVSVMSVGKEREETIFRAHAKRLFS